MTNQEKYAIVFGGGGSRGAFEVGVWSAIQDLKIPVGLIIGSSIGAINATFAVQGANLAEIYNQLTLQDVIPNTKLNSNKDIFALENLGVILGGVLKNKAYSTDSLRNFLNQFLNLEKIYSSEIDLGVVTCSIPSMRPLIAFKNEIPKDQLLDYVLASSGFPIFKPQRINGKSYVDGGFWDNVPVNVAIHAGFSKIIAVDLSSVGMRKPTKKGAEVFVIKAPRGSLGGLFEVRPELISQNIRFGYSSASTFQSKF